jgi:hypothetical protein
MDEPPVVSAAEILLQLGRETYDRVLTFGVLHHDDQGRPCWTVDEIERILGLIKRENERLHQ